MLINTPTNKITLRHTYEAYSVIPLSHPKISKGSYRHSSTGKYTAVGQARLQNEVWVVGPGVRPWASHWPPQHSVSC